MPKPNYATAEDLASAKAELEQEIGQKAPEKSLKKAKEELKKELAELSQKLAKEEATSEEGRQRIAGDAKAYADSTGSKVKKEVLAELEKTSGEHKSSEASLLEHINKVNEGVRSALAEEITNLCAHFDKELDRVKQEMMEGTQKMGSEAAHMLVDTRNTLSTGLDELRKASEARHEELKAALDAESKRIAEAMKKADEQVDSRAMTAESDIHLKIDGLAERLDAEIADFRETTDDNHKSIKDGAAGDLGAFREEAEKRLDGLDSESEKLRNAVSEVENLSTRRVDWVIKHVSHRLRPRTPSKQASLHTSWFSPKFDAAGAHGLQLELQVFRPSDPPVEGEAEGDCALYLWACKGMSIVYRLSIGSKTATMEKVFNGRVPFGTKRLCFLRNQINREDDTLRISVEILEAVREIQHVIEPPPPPASLEDAEKQVEQDPSQNPLEGSICLRRHINNRLYEQVKTQVQLMQSRMIRRVEWRLEHASLLQRCFPPGEPMCSPTFSCAGVENMQLMFYPNGYNGATEAYCSVYLYSPAGVSLKCTLWAGSQRRDMTHFFEASGAFGRTNFCRMESCVDEEDDTVLLAMDVEEAHQDVKATIAHPAAVPGDRRSQSAIDGASAGPVQSVVKLQKNPGKPTAGLEELRVLPSLWTAKPMSEKGGGGLDGLRPFDDLKAGRAGTQEPRGRASPDSSPATLGSLSRRSESTPLMRRSLREGEEDMLPPLGGSMKSRRRQKGGNTSAMQLLQAGVP